MISVEKVRTIEKKMKSLSLFEKDIEETFMRSSGPGGQHANKASTCVRIKHIPTGIAVRCEQTRERHANRWIARRILCEKYEAQILHIETEKAREIAKIRRQKKRRSRRTKEKMLKEKKARAEIKALRKPPTID